MDFQFHHLPTLAEQRREEVLREVRHERLLGRKRPGPAKRGFARASRAIGHALIRLGAHLDAREEV